MTRKNKSHLGEFSAAVKSLFTFTQREKKGFLIIAGFQTILIITLFCMRFIEPDPPVDFKKLDETVALYNELLAIDSMKQIVTKHDSTERDEKKENHLISLFKFNPNRLADSLWMKLGLTEKQTATIKNYEKKGGVFYSKKDVKKMYCLSDEEYSRLAPYIDLPEERVFEKRDTIQKPMAEKVREKEGKTIEPVELNIATEEELQALPAIGEGRASSIINYREKLGGFVRKEQLLEVFSINDSVYRAIENYILINVMRIQRININSKNTFDLRHPYLDKSIAKVLINYRKVHGDFKSVLEIKNLEIMSENDFKKIEPYLKVN
jgi:competence ComEA-like helix-hairpin-helix protein